MPDTPKQTAESSIQRIGIIANPDKPHAPEAAMNAIRWIHDSNRQTFLNRTSSQLCEPLLNLGERAWHTRDSIREVCEATDLILVFGGDGTMLGACREIAEHNGPPVFGVNLGRLGFLTSISADQLQEALQRIWKDDFMIDSRTLLEASVMDKPDLSENAPESDSQKLFALNEFVISREQVSRVVEVEAYVNEQLLTRYYGDGLIVSSPTGSTAYSLSAGGPVVSPEAEVVVLTPICPHALSIRSVVVPLDARIRIQAPSRSHSDTILTADGQNQMPVAEGQSIHIRCSRHRIRLIRFSNPSFFETLSQKMKWGGAFGEDSA
jgi:NAD+ kinase